jgi:hypothetical protein
VETDAFFFRVEKFRGNRFPRNNGSFPISLMSHAMRLVIFVFVDISWCNNKFPSAMCKPQGQ